MLPTITSPHRLVDQRSISRDYAEPIGVAWKLHPPRLDSSRKEICIDNDIVFDKPIQEIQDFLDGDCTLLLEGDSRTYGRFEDYVPPGFEINSGIYGMPANFDLHSYVRFYCRNDFELNAKGEHLQSRTFDEQGLIALALLNYHKYVIIPRTTVTQCEHELIKASAMHFVGLNRRDFHQPFALFNSLNTKLYL